MFIGEKVVETVLRNGLNDLVAQANLQPALWSSLADAEREAAQQWLRENWPTKINIVQAYPRRAPTAPIIAIVPAGESETEPPLGGHGATIADAATGTFTDWRGSWFQHSYRCMIVSDNADVCTWITAAIKFTLLRYRDYLTQQGFVEQNVSVTELGPAEEFSDPQIDVFQQGVMLSGKAFAEFPEFLGTAVQQFSLQPTYTSQGQSSAEIIAFGAPINDVFGRADNTTTLGAATSGQAWTALGGKWGIQSNQAYLVTAEGSGKSAATTDAATWNITASATIASAPLGARLVMRMTDKNNGFILEATSTQYLLKRIQAGVFTTIGTFSLAPAAGDVVKVVLLNTTITVYINSAFAGQVLDSFNGTATLFGIGGSDTTSVRFSAFSAT